LHGWVGFLLPTETLVTPAKKVFSKACKSAKIKKNVSVRTSSHSNSIEVGRDL